MADLHLTQVAFFRPILNGLADAGGPVGQLLRRSQLDRFQIEDPELYVPVDTMYCFFDMVTQTQGITTFADTFSRHYDLDKLGEWGRYICECPDLLTACRASIEFDAHFMTNQRLRLDIRGPRAMLRNWYTDPPSVGRMHVEEISLVLMLNGFRLAGGSDWVPMEIHVTGESIDHLAPVLPLERTVVKFGQPGIGFVFPTALLAQPMAGAAATRDREPPSRTPGESLSEKIEQILRSTRNNVVPTADVIADTIGTSTRTLQRRLASEGTSISAVVDQWRFKTALRLLENPRLQVHEIAEHVRYNHRPNFYRAFKRWTGLTPDRYRDGLAAEQVDV